MVLPWVPGAIRALLLADPTFAALVPAARVVYKSPPLVTTPYAVVHAPGGFPLTGDGVAWSPLIQVDGCCPADDPTPYATAWRIAVEAARILGRARNVTYQTMSYSARLTDGPLSDEDTSRGAASPIYRAIIRAELVAKTT